MTKIALFGAGGKMGRRLTAALKDCDYDMSYVEIGQEGTSVLAELGLSAGYHLRPNMVVRASYNLMWISSVALAPEQLVFAQGTPGTLNAAAVIHSDGVINMQSLNLGLEIDW